MDSPVEFGPVDVREFQVDRGVIRLAVHHAGTAAELDGFVRDVERIVAEQREIFGEFPAYEQGRYTFLADYLPHASPDGMEHRNSTVMTSPGTLRTDRLRLLDTVSHEFFHGWNVERIRPRSLEPFNFEDHNASGELWLGEGFTQYYGSLVLKRAGLVDVQWLARTLNGYIGSVAHNPARLVRSAEEMSLMASFTDGAPTVDPTNWPRTVISYYQFGAAIALALDLSLRDRSNGSITLDDFMRAMWKAHGQPGGTRPGYVDRPYTVADAEARLAEVSDSPAFARDFFRRYVHGNDLAEYSRLLLRAGLLLRPEQPGRAWVGDVQFDSRGGRVLVASPPPNGSPAYDAGLELDDEILLIDGARARSAGDMLDLLRRGKPGERVDVTFVDRTGRQRTSTLQLGEDPALELVPIESIGGPLTADQRAFRSRWLD
jgi:predicted metalloprotease with PDZ domain